MNFFSSISAKLKIPVVLQVLLILVVGFCYLSSDYAVRAQRAQTKEMGMAVGRLQSITSDIQLYLRGRGDFKTIDAGLRGETERVDRFPIGGKLAPLLRRTAEVLQGASLQLQRNISIEKEVFALSNASIDASDSYIMEVSAKLANPARERSVSSLTRAVLAAAAVNSGTNHSVQTLFVRMRTDITLQKQMVAFIDTAISNCVVAEKKLAGTPLVVLPTKALQTNKQIRALVMEFGANNEKIAEANKEIDSLISSLRRELDGYAQQSMLAGYDYFQGRMMMLLLVISGGAVALAILNWSLSSSILHPIKAMTDVLRNISQGEGDLTQRLPITSKDEIGEACGLFNVFVEKLHGIIGQVAQTAGEVASSSGRVNASSGHLAESTEEIASKAATLATASEEMAATITGIAENCNLAAGNSHLANTAAATGAAVIESTIAGMGRIAANTRLSASTVAALGTRSEQIGEIVATIEDIADQTNLLALNAAIEAARAGEQGRGFAVVADEVRALAERTTKATREIGEMIKNIQGETRKAVSVMEEGVSEVDRGSADATRSGEALVEIIAKINEVALQVARVATAAEQQSLTTGEIASNIMQMTEVVHESSRSAKDSASAASQLSGLAGNLQGLMGHFRL